MIRAQILAIFVIFQIFVQLGVLLLLPLHEGTHLVDDGLVVSLILDQDVDDRLQGGLGLGKENGKKGLEA